MPLPPHARRVRAPPARMRVFDACQGVPGRPAGLPAAEAIAELRPGQAKGMRIRRDSGAQCGSGEFRAAAKVPGLAVEYIRAGAPGRAAA